MLEPPESLWKSIKYDQEQEAAPGVSQQLHRCRPYSLIRLNKKLKPMVKLQFFLGDLGNSLVPLLHAQLNLLMKPMS